jgi:hypothetical protein
MRFRSMLAAPSGAKLAAPVGMQDAPGDVPAAGDGYVAGLDDEPCFRPLVDRPPTVRVRPGVVDGASRMSGV